MSAFAEPFALGFSSGLTCLSSCGAVLAPWLVSSKRGFAGTGGLLCVFLGGRLAGYLLFAAAAWCIGSLVPTAVTPEAGTLGWIDLILAALLGCGAALGLAKHTGGCAAARWEKLRDRFGWTGAAILGLLTGLNVCPPFVAATVRALQSGSLSRALLFFAIFFLGTSIWFLPFVGSGWLRRWSQVPTVARITLALVATYYGIMGVVLLLVSRIGNS